MMDGWKGVKETCQRRWLLGEASLSLSSLPLIYWSGTAGYYFGAGEYRLTRLFLKVWRPKNTETAISMGQSEVRWW